MAPSLEGYWGKQTSTVDWCEENYVVSYYIAEFWNTLSNAVIFLPPLIMLSFAIKQNYEYVFVHSFLAMTVVGIGSWFFHMTLRYTMQLMDEVPMLWANVCFIYGAFMIKTKPNSVNRPLQLLLFTACSLLTLMYILVQVPEFLQVSYGALNIIVIVLYSKIMLTMESERKLFITGLACYLIGFLLWNVDNLYCHHLRSIRGYEIARASGILFQCHAWWHIFSGCGAYLGILYALHTRSLYIGRKPQIRFFLGCMPYLSLQPNDKQ